MPMNCDNCGAEIFSGQRFCRSCGRPTNHLTEENVPTQMMPPSLTAERLHTDTAPPSNPQTSPVYTPPGYYQPTVPPIQSVPQYVPPRTRTGWGWIIALVGAVVFSFIVMGVFFLARVVRRPRPPLPPLPPPINQAREGVLTGDEVVTDRETVITPKTYVLAPNGKFFIQNPSGAITIEGSDGPQAEVTVTKRGGTEQDRRAVDIRVSSEGGNLSLRTAPTRGGRVEVAYIVRLPRKLGEVHIDSASSRVDLSELSARVMVNNSSGSISLSGIKGNASITTSSGDIVLSRMTGNVSVESTSGSVQLSDVDGGITAKSVSGDIEVGFETVIPSHELKVQSTSGKVDLRLASIPNADLKIDTVSGDIDVDKSTGINTRFEGRGVRTRLGEGGQPWSISTVSGRISITK